MPIDAVMERELTETYEALNAKPFLDEEYEFSPIGDQETYAAGAPGVGGASNFSPVFDEYDKYLADIVARLMQDFDINEDDAYAFVYEVADSCAETGELPAPMSEESSEEDCVAWMSAAKMIHFGGLVMSDAEASAD